MNFKFKGAIFDLDGVIVDTAKYHYLAWKRLANDLRFEFTTKDNERLKGISRAASLDILLETGGINATQEQKELMACIKNNWYIESLQDLNRDELLPGTFEYLTFLHNKDVKIALGSASKNAKMILNKLDILCLFDAIVDGTCIKKAKPDPEAFLTAAELINIKPDECVVFEDAQSGIEAAKSAGIKVIAVGTPEQLKGADFYIKNLGEML